MAETKTLVGIVFVSILVVGGVAGGAGYLIGSGTGDTDANQAEAADIGTQNGEENTNRSNDGEVAVDDGNQTFTNDDSDNEGTGDDIPTDDPDPVRNDSDGSEDNVTQPPVDHDDNVTNGSDDENLTEAEQIIIAYYEGRMEYFETETEVWIQELMFDDQNHDMWTERFDSPADAGAVGTTNGMGVAREYPPGFYEDANETVAE